MHWYSNIIAWMFFFTLQTVCMYAYDQFLSEQFIVGTEIEYEAELHVCCRMKNFEYLNLVIWLVYTVIVNS